jgi:hypothetical protein
MEYYDALYAVEANARIDYGLLIPQMEDAVFPRASLTISDADFSSAASLTAIPHPGVMHSYGFALANRDSDHSVIVVWGDAAPSVTFFLNDDEIAKGYAVYYRMIGEKIKKIVIYKSAKQV